MQDYRTTKVWKAAHELVVDIYAVSDRLPVPQRIGLVDHVCRTAGSISFNIAEGFGRNSHADLARFLEYAKGSANELEAQLLLARDTGRIESEPAGELLARVATTRRMLVGLLREVRRQANDGPPWHRRTG